MMITARMIKVTTMIAALADHWRIFTIFAIQGGEVSFGRIFGTGVSQLSDLCFSRTFCILSSQRGPLSSPCWVHQEVSDCTAPPAATKPATAAPNAVNVAYAANNAMTRASLDIATTAMPLVVSLLEPAGPVAAGIGEQRAVGYPVRSAIGQPGRSD